MFEDSEEENNVVKPKKNNFKMESPEFYRKIKIKDLKSSISRDRSSSA